MFSQQPLLSCYTLLHWSYGRTCIKSTQETRFLATIWEDNNLIFGMFCVGWFTLRRILLHHPEWTDGSPGQDQLGYYKPSLCHTLVDIHNRDHSWCRIVWWYRHCRLCEGRFHHQTLVHTFHSDTRHTSLSLVLTPTWKDCIPWDYTAKRWTPSGHRHTCKATDLR